MLTHARTPVSPPDCRYQLFTDSLTLPPFIGAARATVLSKRDMASMASGVHRRYTVLMRDLTPWLDVMPDPWKARLIYLKECVDREIAQVGLGCVCLGREGRGPSQELFAALHLMHTQPTFCVCVCLVWLLWAVL